MTTVTVWIVAPTRGSADERAADQDPPAKTYTRVTRPSQLPDGAAGQLLFAADWRDCWPAPNPDTGDPTAERGPGPLLARAHALPELDVEVVN